MLTSSNTTAKRLLQDLMSCLEHGLLPEYAHNDVTKIEREIVWRYEELKSILEQHKKDLHTIIRYASTFGNDNLALCVVEFPYCALWTHLSMIQELVRTLKIYRYHRIRWIHKAVIENKPFGGIEFPSSISSKLSSTEIKFTKKLMNVVQRYVPTMHKQLLGTTFANMSPWNILAEISRTPRLDHLKFVGYGPSNEFNNLADQNTLKWDFANLLFANPSEVGSTET